jgi:hypothetical protein
MDWHDIIIAPDQTHFLLDGKPIFGKQFKEVLKFHAPGLAPVKDETGSFHIDCMGRPLYEDRYDRTFGFYCNRAAVVKFKTWFHLNEKGDKAYQETYSWTGNYQENLCAVRNAQDQYFHIELNGQRVYAASYIYVGDFKDGIACVKSQNGLFRHIDARGNFINQKEFDDLGVFHKNYATAKDKLGWHHIDKLGNEVYAQRYLAVEPFYNGFALVTCWDHHKDIIDEHGEHVLSL